jgi:hypothetical protein
VVSGLKGQCDLPQYRFFSTGSLEPYSFWTLQLRSLGRRLEVFLPRFFCQCLGCCDTMNEGLNWVAMSTVKDATVGWMRLRGGLSVHLLSIVEVGVSLWEVDMRRKIYLKHLLS